MNARRHGPQLKADGVNCEEAVEWMIVFEIGWVGYPLGFPDSLRNGERERGKGGREEGEGERGGGGGERGGGGGKGRGRGERGGGGGKGRGRREKQATGNEVYKR